jgi:Deoxyribonuclease NucA/NucB
MRRPPIAVVVLLVFLVTVLIPLVERLARASAEWPNPHAEATSSRGACTRPGGTVTVQLSRSRYPESTLHFEVAWSHGAPRRYTIARKRADRNRDAWDDLVPVGVDADNDGKTDDRDEVPMAFTREGGRKAPNGESASHIAYVNASDNRGAGSSIGGKLRRYCNGTRFKIHLIGKRWRTAVIVVALRNGRQVHQLVRRR